MLGDGGVTHACERAGSLALCLLLELGDPSRLLGGSDGGLSSLSSLGSSLLGVGLLVEGDEEEQVRREESAAEDGGALSARARSVGRERGEVG